MKKKSLYLALVIAPICFIIIGANDPQTTGAPPSSTGAPGETTCAKSGCHTGQNVNSGTGITSFTFNSNLETYSPGETYPVTISILQEGINRFGFECVVVANDDSTNAGTFIITDDTRTQVLPGSNQFEGREYLTYTYKGTSPYTDGVGEWSFDWKAPPVTFYIATVAANNDATDDGDLVYTKMYEVKSKATGLNKNIHETTSFKCYPNPAKDFINIGLGDDYNKITKLSLINLSGEVLYSLHNIPKLSRQSNYTINLQALSLSQGIYFLHLESNHSTTREKIVITK